MLAGSRKRKELHFGKFISSDLRVHVCEDKLTFDNGDEYNGEFNIENQRHGEGVYKWASGETYEGSWIQNKQNGWGTVDFKKCSCSLSKCSRNLN